MKTKNNYRFLGTGFIKIASMLLIMLFSLNNCWSNSSSHNDMSKTESNNVQSDQTGNDVDVQNEDQILLANAQLYQIENDIDSICVDYWNAVGSDYDSYIISYSYATKKMAIFVEYIKNHPVYYIDSVEVINLFLSSIDDFYLKKTVSIIEKKTKYDTDEHVEYEIPTFTISCYKKGKRVLLSNTLLEDGDYELLFNPKFDKFKEMIFSIVKDYDKFVENLGE